MHCLSLNSIPRFSVISTGNTTARCNIVRSHILSNALGDDIISAIIKQHTLLPIWYHLNNIILINFTKVNKEYYIKGSCK